MRGFGWKTMGGLLLAGAVGCQGAIGDDGERDGGGATCDVGPGRVGLQRLTRAEYNRTVRDLFGVTSNPADAFPPDSATDGFDNNAKSLTVSPQLASLLLSAAEEVALEALAEDDGTILHCAPSGDAACLRAILERLALRVYRRPASEAELDELVQLVAYAESEGETTEAGVSHALSAMLMAPQFLYRGVPIAAPDLTKPFRPLDDYALATRLAYFLWGSTPDDALLAAAGQGDLRLHLRDELDRMLVDSKSEALYDGFITQWLQLGKLDAATPDPATFPEFDETLRAQMREETRLFFDDLRARDASPLEIINGTASFASAGLASLYGVSGPASASLEPVSLDPSQRAGILTMPAILTMTSGPEQPNIVRRGVWLAEAILCATPPPPPPGVSLELDPTPGLTERERLEAHRQDPSCASCHDLIDPLGFGFEHYDALGRWRDDIDGESIDDLGRLPDGREFQGVVALSQMLSESPDFAECITERVTTYALGRTMSEEEACVVAAIAAENVSLDSKLSDLLWAVVSSDAFQMEVFTP
ncbi:MAG: DUF1592 domain-containing protein [Myxococcales bacterium]|nr:DUF1592 domain-containing protein [Myxococcales bacterium]